MTRAFRSAFVLATLLLLAACAGTAAPPPTPAAVAIAPAPQFRQCVPYARHHSGIELYGDAWTWWETAAGRYARGPLPRPGSVLVLRRTERLKHGHVAVVRDIVDRRQILVDHANWGAGASDPATNMGVADISPSNDWTLVRFWNEAAGAWGRPYPAYGFIYRAPDASALAY
jgi:surface antigen